MFREQRQDLLPPKWRSRLKRARHARAIEGRYFYNSWKRFCSVPATGQSSAIPTGRFKKVLRNKGCARRRKSETGMLLFALSVDNSLLDPIHPFSNSNSENFSSPRKPARTYSITSKQTSNRSIRAGIRPSLARQAIRVCTYTNPRNKPVAEGNGRRGQRVCLENKNASSKLVYPTRNVPALTHLTPQLSLPSLPRP